MTAHTPRPAAGATGATATALTMIETLETLRPGLDEEQHRILNEALAWAASDSGAAAGGDSATAAPALAERIGVLEILRELGLDSGAMVAVLVHRAPTAAKQARRFAEHFGEDTLELLRGVQRMEALSLVTAGGDSRSDKVVSMENLRKMLLAMVDDVRVVPVALAWQLYRMRHSDHRNHNDPASEALARHTLEVFAPLSNRLGIWQIKWELEDLALRRLEPAAYHKIAGSLAERRVSRQRYIALFIRTIKTELEKNGIRGEVSGRPKHIYSIWKKMQRKELEFDHIYDVRAVRVLVDTTQDCYAALGVVHTLWSHIPGEFNDYIATPKENNYQSLHTAVLGPRGKAVEVQIRTRDMHRENELGVAAHWRYKEGAPDGDKGLDGKIAWLRQLLEWKDEVSTAAQFVDRFKSEVFDERVYVFTPKGRVVDLPSGSTPVDFAYAIHTEVGHHCRGARVNGRIVPLNRPLQNGEQVEVLSVKSGGPSRDWLDQHQGYLHTARARARVQRWFKEANYEINMAAGRSLLEKELHRLGLGGVKFERLAGALKYKKADDLLAAIGSGDLRIAQAVAPLRSSLRESSPPTPAPAPKRARAARAKTRGFTVQGVGNLLTNHAKCCKPVPGDPILGYITQGRGVTIHRCDCKNILRQDPGSERLLQVDWGGAEHNTWPVEIRVAAYDRPGLLSDITAVFADARVNLSQAHMDTDRAGHGALVRLSAEVADLDGLSRILGRVARLPNVREVKRLSK